MRSATLASLALLLLGACTYDFPLADASQAVSDDQLVGIWHLPDFPMADDSGSAELLLLPLPRNQYLLTFTVSSPDTEEPKADASPCERAFRGWAVLQGYYIAYLTELDGARFLNLQAVCEDEKFAFARYWIRGDTARFVTVDDLQGPFANSAEVAAAVRARLEDPALYADTIVAYRVSRRTISVAWPGTTR
jgi:hypothetical protein